MFVELDVRFDEAAARAAKRLYRRFAQTFGFIRPASSRQIEAQFSSNHPRRLRRQDPLVEKA